MASALALLLLAPAAREAEEVREYSERAEAEPPSEASGSLADKLRGVIEPRER